MKNCPNCGSPLEPYKCKCEHCGTWYYDLDENYFINTPKAQELIDRLIADGTLDEINQFDENSREREPIDLSIKKPRSIEFANCVSARTDRGISNHQAEGSGVCQLS